jgi:hypothetical protein
METFYTELKNAAGAKSSEELFGLPERTAETCDLANKIIEIAETIKRNSNVEHCVIFETAYESVSITSENIGELLTLCEQLKAQNIELRKWGEAWKILAKKVAKARLKDLNSYLPFMSEDQIKNVLQSILT